MVAMTIFAINDHLQITHDVKLRPALGVTNSYIFEMDMTFHKLSCDEVQFDVSNSVDVQVELDVDLSQQTVRKDESGQVIEEPYERPGSDTCLPCGPAGAPGQCCNTCQQLRKTIRKSHNREAFKHVRDFPQCQQGCRTQIKARARPGEGSVRLFPGKKEERPDGAVRYTFDQEDLQTWGWDPSHTIHKFAFVDGNRVSNGKSQLPPQFVKNTADINAYRYVIDVIPSYTMDSQGNESVKSVNSVSLQKMFDTKVPGFNIKYHFEGFEFSNRHFYPGWASLFKTVIWIIGGGTALMNLLYSLIFSLRSKGESSPNVSEVEM